MQEPPATVYPELHEVATADDVHSLALSGHFTHEVVLAIESVTLE